MTFFTPWSSKIQRASRRKVASASRQLEQLELRLMPSFLDGNGAVVISLTEQNNGSELVIEFDGPLDASPTNAAQSPTNLANYALQVPSSNPQMITSSLSSVAINSAS